MIVRRVSNLRYRVPAFIFHNREMFGPYLPTQTPRVGNEAMGGSHLALIVMEIKSISLEPGIAYSKRSYPKSKPWAISQR